MTSWYETTPFRSILIFTSGKKNSEHENEGACSSSGKSHRELALTDHVHLYDDVFANFMYVCPTMKKSIACIISTK